MQHGATNNEENKNKHTQQQQQQQQTLFLSVLGFGKKMSPAKTEIKV